MIKYSEGFDYVIENGLWVWTRDFLFRRGYCCHSGCRNCPWAVIIGKEYLNHDPLHQGHEAPIDPIQ